MSKFRTTLLIIFSLLILGCNNTTSPETPEETPSDQPTYTPEEKPELLPEGTPDEDPIEPPKDPQSDLILTSNVPQYKFLAPEHSIKLTLSKISKTKTLEEKPANIEWSNSNESIIAITESSNESVTLKGIEVGFSTITATDTNTGHKAYYTAEVRDAEVIIVDNETRFDIPDLIQLEKNTSSNKYEYKTRILYWDSKDNQIKQFVRPDISCRIAGSYSNFFDIQLVDEPVNGITKHYITFVANERNTFEHNNNQNIFINLTTDDLGNNFKALSKTISLQSYGDKENTEFNIKEILIGETSYNGNNITLSDNKQVQLTVSINKKNKLTMYDFDQSSIEEKTGADADGKVIEYSGLRVIDGKEYPGLPIYNHNGTDWIQLKEHKITDYEDTWIFNISPNLTSRNRKVSLPFVADNKKSTITINQPRSYNQQETVIWFSGVTPPSKDAYVPETYEPLYYVNEQQGNFSSDGTNSNFTGWFNVNKIAGNADLPQDMIGIYKDSSMCWAMAASNLIHWWANQNKDNLKALIDLRIEQNNDQEGKDLGFYDFEYTYDYSTGTTKDAIQWQIQRKNKSKVGDTVRRLFIDSSTGGDPVIIFNWYFENLDNQYKGFFETNYRESKYNKGLGLLNGISAFTGFDETNTKKHIYHVEGAGNREDTNRFFKDVINNEKAVMYLYKFGGSESNKHYVTAWAVIYDNYGDVIGMYTADNNMPSFAVYHEAAPSNSYLIKNRIAFKDDSSRPLIISAASPFNERAVTSCKNEFNLLYSIQSGKKEIAEYLQSQGK